jgi:hypothetical protein
MDEGQERIQTHVTCCVQLLQFLPNQQRVSTVPSLDNPAVTLLSLSLRVPEKLQKKVKQPFLIMSEQILFHMMLCFLFIFTHFLFSMHLISINLALFLYLTLTVQKTKAVGRCNGQYLNKVLTEHAKE